MKQHYINKIREACIKANPEIVELKLRKGILCLGRIKGERFITSYDVVVHDNNFELLEIMGRPIQLADIFLVIEMKPITDTEMSATYDQIIAMWNLKETLENQDLPTLKFVADLL